MVAQTVCNTGNPSGNRCSANRERKTYRDYRCCCNAPCASLQKALQPAPGLQYSTVHRNEGDRLAQAVWRHTGSTTIQLSPPEAGSGAVSSVCSDVALRGRDQRHFCKVPASRSHKEPYVESLCCSLAKLGCFPSSRQRQIVDCQFELAARLRDRSYAAPCFDQRTSSMQSLSGPWQQLASPPTSFRYHQTVHRIRRRTQLS